MNGEPVTHHDGVDLLVSRLQLPLSRKHLYTTPHTDSLTPTQQLVLHVQFVV